MQITRSHLRQLILEQLNQSQLDKLKIYLYSDNEADIRQGLLLVQSFLDEDNEYPGVKDLYYRAAASRDAEISQLKTEISHLEQQHAEVDRELKNITNQIKKHKDSSAVLDQVPRASHRASTGRSMLKRITGIDTSQDKLNAMKKKFTRLMYTNLDNRQLIDEKQEKLQILLSRYRIFEEFPIHLDYGSRGSVVIQDPMMETNQSRRLMPVTPKWMKK